VALDKGKPDQSQGRKATGPLFLRETFRFAMQDHKTAGLPQVAVDNPLPLLSKIATRDY